MNTDEIIEMARQAGYDDIEERGIYMFENFDVEAFAKLVYDRGWMGGYTSCDNDNKTLTSALIADAINQEREACAKVCDELDLDKGEANWYSQLIRARGEA
jgi:hypothetical protein